MAKRHYLKRLLIEPFIFISKHINKIDSIIKSFVSNVRESKNKRSKKSLNIIPDTNCKTSLKKRLKRKETTNKSKDICIS